MNISTPLRLTELDDFKQTARGERVSPPKRERRPLALGIRENTRVTVTAREELFALTQNPFGFLSSFSATGSIPSFSYYLKKIFSRKGEYIL